MSKVLKIKLIKVNIRLHPRYSNVGNQWNLPVRQSRKLPKVYMVDGRWFKDIKAGARIIRVVGIDLPMVAARLHPVTIIPRSCIPPLPGKRECCLYSKILERFRTNPSPLPAKVNWCTIDVDARGYRWVLIKVKHFPAWHARNGRIFIGPGGTMVILVNSSLPRVILHFSFPTWLYSVGVVGFTLGVLALVLRRITHGSEIRLEMSTLL